MFVALLARLYGIVMCVIILVVFIYCAYAVCAYWVCVVFCVFLPMVCKAWCYDVARADYARLVYCGIVCVFGLVVVLSCFRLTMFCCVYAVF